jgi:hypothetical protein
MFQLFITSGGSNMAFSCVLFYSRFPILVQEISELIVHVLWKAYNLAWWKEIVFHLISAWDPLLENSKIVARIQDDHQNVQCGMKMIKNDIVGI